MIVNRYKAVEPVITLHAEEAAFLWLLRDAAVTEPHYSLKDLEKLDNRLLANLDGLRIAGDNGWKICADALALEEPGEIFMGACLSFESDRHNRIQTVIDAGSTDPELSRAIVSALGFIPYQTAEKHIKNFSGSETVELQRIGIAASAIHRKDPGIRLSQALKSDDTRLRARALKAVGELAKKELFQAVRVQMSDENEKCRFYAAWASALTGDRSSLEVLRTISENGGDYSEKACVTAVAGMKPADSVRWVQALASSGKKTRLAAICAGYTGDPTLIPQLTELMEKPDYARVAGESFTMITGADIAFLDLEGDWPEGFETGPTENPDDENVMPDTDEDLPWPEQKLVQKWWDKNSGNFRKGTRYLLGKPATPAWLQQVLISGKQRQRALAALQLAINQPESPLHEVRGPGFTQTAPR